VISAALTAPDTAARRAMRDAPLSQGRDKRLGRIEKAHLAIGGHRANSRYR
jgi:hypothetical protein